MSNWIKLEERMPQEGQYCWVAYYPWNNKSNPVAVQPATWRNGLWLLDGNPTSGEGGTSYPPIAWRPNANEGPPLYETRHNS